MTAEQFNNQLLELEPGLKAFSRRLTRNDLSAKDLLQETFLKALSYKDKFIDNTSLKSWTYRIMQNTYFNSYKIKNRYYFSDCLTETLPGTNSDFPDTFLNLEYINNKIGSLTDQLKDTFELYLIGYQFKEIAEILQIKVGTAKSRVFYAKEYLKKNLEDFQLN